MSKERRNPIAETGGQNREPSAAVDALPIDRVRSLLR
jgi:hypothetical protein